LGEGRKGIAMMGEYDEDSHYVADVEDEVLINELVRQDLNYIEYIDDEIIIKELIDRGFKGAVLLKNDLDFENAQHYRDRGDRSNALNSLGHALGKDWHYFLTTETTK
jgi:hypothetical protein